MQNLFSKSFTRINFITFYKIKLLFILKLKKKTNSISLQIDLVSVWGTISYGFVSRICSINLGSHTKWWQSTSRMHPHRVLQQWPWWCMGPHAVHPRIHIFNPMMIFRLLYISNPMLGAVVVRLLKIWSCKRSNHQSSNRVDIVPAQLKTP